MNKRYTKRWLIEEAVQKSGLPKGKCSWSVPDRSLAMAAGLIEGNETRNKMRAILNAAYLNRKIGAAADEGFYKSREWKALRYQALVLHGGRCQCCGATAQDGAVLHVDHIKPKSKYPALALEITNLQVLCADCNMGKSNKDETDWRPLDAANDSGLQHIRSIVEGQ